MKDNWLDALWNEKIRRCGVVDIAEKMREERLRLLVEITTIIIITTTITTIISTIISTNIITASSSPPSSSPPSSSPPSSPPPSSSPSSTPDNHTVCLPAHNPKLQRVYFLFVWPQLADELEPPKQKTSLEISSLRPSISGMHDSTQQHATLVCI